MRLGLKSALYGGASQENTLLKILPLDKKFDPATVRS
jgi:hypothetical protein